MINRSDVEEIDETIIIIGAGPAGISAAVQLKRMGHDPLMIEQDCVGGFIRNAYRVDNLPFAETPMTGKQVFSLIRSFWERFSIRTIIDRIVSIGDHESKGIMLTSLTRRFVSDRIIVATGTKPKPPSISIPDHLRHRFVDSMDALLERLDQTNHGNLAPSPPVCIIGSGDCAFDYALSMNQRGVASFLLVRKQIKAIPLLQKEVEARKIPVYLNSQASNISKSKWGLSVGVDQMQSDGSTRKITMNASFILSAIGRLPSMIPGCEERAANLRFADRIFLVGDVAHPEFRQVGIALGDGLQAAMKLDQQRRNAL